MSGKRKRDKGDPENGSSNNSGSSGSSSSSSLSSSSLSSSSLSSSSLSSSSLSSSSSSSSSRSTSSSNGTNCSSQAFSLPSLAQTVGLLDHLFSLITVNTGQKNKAKPKRSLTSVLAEEGWKVDDVEFYFAEDQIWMDLEDNKDFFALVGERPKIRVKTAVSVFRRVPLPHSLRSELRACQETALAKARDAFRSGRDRMLIVLPTGVGKTMVMAFAPFFCYAKRVLIITPNVTLAVQHLRKLPTIYGKPNVSRLLALTGFNDVIIDNRLEQTSVEPDISITNIQNLISRERRKDDATQKKDDATQNASSSEVSPKTKRAMAKEKKAEAGEKKSEAGEKKGPKKKKKGEVIAEGANLEEKNEIKEKVLRPEVSQYIKRANPDLILIDEGHHFPVDSIKVFLNELQQINTAVKMILLTATPSRGDGLRYDLDSEDQVYIYTRAEAMRDGFIKRVEPQFIAVETSGTKREWAVQPLFLNPLLTAAALQLIEMRKRCGGFPHRALVLMNEKTCCATGAEMFNKLSAEQKWNLSADYLTSEDRANGEFTATEKKFSTTAASEPKIDFLFQCGTFGEGYDNSAIGMCVIVNVPSVLSKFSQFIGRGLRISEEMDQYLLLHVDAQQTAKQAFKTSYVIMPDLTNMRERFEDFESAADEDIQGIFTEGQTNGDFKLGNFHRAWTKRNSDWLFHQMTKEQYLSVHYHRAYEVARKDWKIIPSRVLGVNVACKLIASDVHILDVGCGRDYIFEASLDAQLNLLKKKYSVKITAVDFVKFDIPEMKQCQVTQLALNFCDPKSLATIRGGASEGTRCFDAAVICLALMSSDFSRTLYHAACLVKPSGHIYVVEHRSKFNILPQFGRLSTQGVDVFIDSLQAAGMRNVTQFQTDQTAFIFLDMLAPDADIDFESFSGSLEQLQFRCA